MFGDVVNVAARITKKTRAVVVVHLYGQPADIGFSVHVPFGPMISIAGALHFLWLHRWVDVLVEQARYVFLFQP